MKRFDKKLSLTIDSLHKRIEDVERLPKSKLRAKALIELKLKLGAVERGIPCTK